jgi:hypothetical protein
LHGISLKRRCTARTPSRRREIISTVTVSAARGAPLCDFKADPLERHTEGFAMAFRVIVELARAKESCLAQIYSTHTHAPNTKRKPIQLQTQSEGLNTKQKALSH